MLMSVYLYCGYMFCDSYIFVIYYYPSLIYFPGSLPVQLHSQTMLFNLVPRFFIFLSVHGINSFFFYLCLFL